MHVKIGHQFVELANPHSWMLTAENLHDQAVSIVKQRGKSVTSVVNADGDIIRHIDGIDKSVFLLAALSLENQIKALLIYEHPHWISNGRLCRALKSHDLLNLRKLSKYSPYRGRYVRFFKILQEGFESWARYPCGLTWEFSGHEQELEAKIWQLYLRIYLSQDKRIRTLLAKGWQGPHGFYGRWIFSCD